MLCYVRNMNARKLAVRNIHSDQCDYYAVTIVLCFLLCMFLLYITVLLPVGVIKDDE